MRTGRLAVVVIGILGVVASGCASSDSPAAGELSGDPVLAMGAEVYGESCASCHGADLRGTDRGPSHLSIVYEPNHHPDESFRSAIAIGTPQHHWPYGDMPPVEGLSGEEVEAVIAFIRSEQERLGFER